MEVVGYMGVERVGLSMAVLISKDARFRTSIKMMSMMALNFFAQK